MVEHVLKTASDPDKINRAQNKHGKTPAHMAAFLGTVSKGFLLVPNTCTRCSNKGSNCTKTFRASNLGWAAPSPLVARPVP